MLNNEIRKLNQWKKNIKKIDMLISYTHDPNNESRIIVLKKLAKPNYKLISYWRVKLKKKTNLKNRTKTKKKPKRIRVKSNIKIKLLRLIKDKTIFFLNNNKKNKNQILYKNQIKQNVKGWN
jgi:hypothetical protein